MNIDFARIAPSLPYILAGVWTTLTFTIISALLGLVWGTLLALCKTSGIRPLAWAAFAYTTVFRGTPLILQLTMVYFATPELFKYDISALQAGVIAFTLNTGAYTSEAIRAGIASIDRGQREAALSLGVPYPRMMLDVILPQAVKTILPSLANETINLLKDSALVSTIGVADILRRANIVAAQTYTYFEPLLFAGLIYYVLVNGLTMLVTMLERRLRRSD